MTANQVCHADVVTRKHDALQREIKSLKPSRTATLWLQYMWTCWIFFGNTSGKSVLATGNFISKPFQKCYHIWRLLGTVTIRNLDWCTFSECPVCKMSMYEHFKQRLHVVRRSDRHWAAFPLTLLLSRCSCIA